MQCCCLNQVIQSVDQMEMGERGRGFGWGTHFLSYGCHWFPELINTRKGGIFHSHSLDFERV